MSNPQSQPANDPPPAAEALPAADVFEMHKAKVNPANVGGSLLSMLDAVERNLEALKTDTPAHRDKRIEQMREVIRGVRPYVEDFASEPVNQSASRITDGLSRGQRPSMAAMIPAGIDLVSFLLKKKVTPDAKQNTRSGFDTGLLE